MAIKCYVAISILFNISIISVLLSLNIAEIILRQHETSHTNSGFFSTTFFILAAVFMWNYNSILQTVYQADSDCCWIDDAMDLYISKEKRFPINWNELLLFSDSYGLIAPISGIEERIEMNERLFVELNSNQWNINNFDNECLWSFRHIRNSCNINDRINTYCHYLRRANGIDNSCACPTSVRRAENGGRDGEAGGEMNGDSGEQ